MYNNFNEVREELRSLFYDTFKAKCLELLGRSINVYFDSLPTDDASNNSGNGFGILQITVEDERQAAISANVKEISKRKFEITGIIIFQMFLPKTESKFEEKLISILHAVKEEFRRPNGCGIWLRNAKVKPLPSEQLLGAANFYCEFNYNEVG